MSSSVSQRGIHLLVITVVTGAVATGCGQVRDRAEQAAKNAAYSAAGNVASSVGKPTPQAASNVSEPAVTPATLTVADLNLYEQDVKARVDWLKQVRDNIAAAKTGMDSARVALSIGSEAPDSTTARTAGVSVQHAQQVNKTVGDIVMTEHLQNQANAARATVDTTKMDPAAKAQMQQVFAQMKASSDSTIAKATAGLSPDVAAEFQKREPELDSLTMQLFKALGPAGKS